MPGTTRSVCSAANAVSRPVTPIGASSKGCSFSSRGAARGRSRRVDRPPEGRDQRLAIVLGAQRRVHLEVGVERRTASSVSSRWCGVASAVTLAPPPWPARSPRASRARTRAGRGSGRPRRPRARSRARPARTRTPTGCPARPSSADTSPSCITPAPDSEASSSWSASRRPASRWYWSACRMTPRTHRQPVVREADRARRRELCHLGQLLAALTDRDRRRKRVGMRASTRARSRSERSTDAESTTGLVFGWREDRAEAASGGCARAGVDVLLVLAARACAGGRAGRRRPGKRAGPQRRRPRRRRAASSPSPISAMTPSRTSRSAAPSSPVRADQHARRRGGGRSQAATGVRSSVDAPGGCVCVRLGPGRRAHPCSRRRPGRGRRAARRAPPSAPRRRTRPAATISALGESITSGGQLDARG